MWDAAWKKLGTLCVEQRFSSWHGYQDPLEDYLTVRLLYSTPRVSDPVGLGWGVRLGASNKFPGGADATGPGTMLRTAVLEDG